MKKTRIENPSQISYSIQLTNNNGYARDQKELWEVEYFEDGHMNSDYFDNEKEADTFLNEKLESAKVYINDVVENTKDYWEKLVSRSGLDEKMFIVHSNEATQMLSEYQLLTYSIKEHYGIDIPPLVEGVSITFKD